MSRPSMHGPRRRASAARRVNCVRGLSPSLRAVIFGPRGLRVAGGSRTTSEAEAHQWTSRGLQSVKARWSCAHMYQQMKEEHGLDHFEGRSWHGLHQHGARHDRLRDHVEFGEAPTLHPGALVTEAPRAVARSAKAPLDRVEMRP